MNRAQLNILFIEDNPDDVDLAVLELSRNGFEINWQRVDTEQHLRQTLSSWKPDVILSDYSMPSFNGMVALDIVQEVSPSIPFIFVSGTIGEELAIESIRKGAHDYLLKDNLRRLGTAIKRAITDKDERQRSSELEKDRSRLITMMEETSDFVAIALPDDSLLYLNKGGRKLLGLTKPNSELSIGDLHAPRTWHLIRREIQPLAIRETVWQGDAILVGEGGTEIPVSQVIIAHKGESGEVEYFSYMARDIRDRKAFENRIEHLANYDPLTGLPNRSLLADRIAQAITYCDWTYRSLALVSININRFKLVNDGYGQEIGNMLLKLVGERLKESVRTRDTIAHLGADTFVILATELSAPDDAAMVIAKIQKALHKPFQIDQILLNVTASVGVSTYPRDGTDFTTLLQNSDIA
ncbi:MAG: diguanylate cyclase, partial [Pseudomonadota bacterium]